MSRSLLFSLLLMTFFARAQPIRPAKGYAVLVGVATTVSKSSIGTDFPAASTEAAPNDALAMGLRLQEEGFEKENIFLLTTPEKTRADTILNTLERVRKLAGPNDLVVFYFSGHGDQRREQLDDPNRDELDTLDELLIAADRPIVDDELQVIWTRIGKAVRLVMIADACHSGSMFAFIDFPIRSFDPFSFVPEPGEVPTKERSQPTVRGSKTHEQRRSTVHRKMQDMQVNRFQAERTFLKTAN